jgi:hypothetical protein
MDSISFKQLLDGKSASIFTLAAATIWSLVMLIDPKTFYIYEMEFSPIIIIIIYIITVIPAIWFYIGIDQVR